VRKLRMIKTAEEVRRLNDAARAAEEAIAKTIAALRLGVTQRELAIVFSSSVARQGARLRLDNVSVGRSSAFGNANVPEDVLDDGSIVRFDVGAIVDGYASDLSRCLVFGEPSVKVDRIYGALLAGLRAALDELRPGIRACDLFETAVDEVRRAGLPHYERTNVGHGIGIAGDGYDPPLLSGSDTTELEPEMVLCVETPYYELGFGGLQIEEMVLVTEGGWQPLTHLPQELQSLGATV
jgi:Xaa-Pro aminopeptidase